jgi:hypothetical protein
MYKHLLIKPENNKKLTITIVGITPLVQNRGRYGLSKSGCCRICGGRLPTQVA